jgi:hypothetical protein
MGFTNESRGGGSKFANFSKGNIVTKIDGEKKTFSHLEGDLVDIDIEDASYQDKPYRKLVLYIFHEDGLTALGFPLNSGYGNAFCRICPNINPAKPIKVSGGITPDEKIKDKFYSSLYIQQGGSYVKWYFKNDTPEGKKVPEVSTQTIGRGKSAKEVKDYSARDEFFEKVILRFLEKVQAIHPKGAAGGKGKVKHQDPDDITEPIDDLPF